MPRNDELVQAAVAGDLETVKRLIEGGADPDSVDQHGMGPLLNFHPAVTHYLLGHGADPDFGAEARTKSDQFASGISLTTLDLNFS